MSYVVHYYLMFGELDEIATRTADRAKQELETT